MRKFLKLKSDFVRHAKKSALKEKNFPIGLLSIITAMAGQGLIFHGDARKMLSISSNQFHNKQFAYFTHQRYYEDDLLKNYGRNRIKKAARTRMGRPH